MNTEPLEKLNACREAIVWAAKQPEAQTAWTYCERGDWMLWLIGKMCEPNSDIHKRLVLAACRCARLSLQYIPAGEMRPLAAIETAERWTRGEATTKEVRAAACASSSAAASGSGYAAASAASAAASGSGYAAAYAYAAARANTLHQCADIVREYFPTPPEAKP